MAYPNLFSFPRFLVLGKWFFYFSTRHTTPHKLPSEPSPAVRSLASVPNRDAQKRDHKTTDNGIVQAKFHLYAKKSARCSTDLSVLPEIYSTTSRTVGIIIPVAPVGQGPSLPLLPIFSENAVPAMSKCTHGVFLSTK